ncbi:hypothetical protein X471_00832 [Bartonella bacilliformis str. Heidi Mejia]|uniref:Lipoprotein n=2 Tax=Bartonella bacilliformis TaxID=774 RepID=A0ABN0IHM5_BARBA|nr:glycine zipper domain-containing protein [Bartonella bacilliformis]ABM45022.1 putative lipoprotein [Bartonella bacilliformis KC583]AMG85356.1 hypothetical protein AL467_00790 [Bartonella bacilliformis]EKS46021.1 putative lipoprotein [Bartonella bacilliformis INS]EYS88739.1 hypothetical protein X472_00826 [Bartonella bacilliformis San Pedro600-02]EYS90700.1 hypothetical protein X471_00832 [Bartonella bacilliformis str. Heidi Mejia]
MLKPILTMTVVSLVGLSSVACTIAERRTAKYGTGGAALGAIAGSALTGTAEGTVVGAALGTLVGTTAGVARNEQKKKRNAQKAPPMCTYQNSQGRQYQAPCPQSQSIQLCQYSDGRGRLYQAPCPQ